MLVLVARYLIAASVISTVVRYAFPYSPPLTLPISIDGEEAFSTVAEYNVLGGDGGMYVSLALFVFGIGLRAYALGWRLPWLAPIVAIPLALGLWALAAASLSRFASFAGIETSFWSKEGLLTQGCCFACALLAAAITTTVILKFSARVLSGKRQAEAPGA